MSAADKIQAARALIEPLTGNTPGPWQVDAPEDESVEITARIFAIAGLYETAPEALPDARLIAAAPALRDNVAALADLADAQAQEIARLREALDPNQTKADYIGEFKQRVCFGADDDGNEIWEDVTISWTVTKQIMAAIRDRAALGDAP